MDLDNVLAVTVSGMRPEEEDAVKSLLSACNLHMSDLTPEKLRHFIVARKGDRVVGAVGLELFQPDALLRSLVVEQGYQGQGVGIQLLKSVERYARIMGAKTLYLLTMTAESFFDRCDFRKVSRDGAPAPLQNTEEFKTLCPDAAACMRKQIA